MSTHVVINLHRQAVRQLATCLRAYDNAVRPATVWHMVIGLKGMGKRMCY